MSEPRRWQTGAEALAAPRTEAGRRLARYFAPPATPATVAELVLAVEAEAAAQAGDLDAAWRDAEAALPEGWHNGPLLRMFAYDLADGGRYYHATAERPKTRMHERRFVVMGEAATPADALRSLTARLRERSE